MNLLAHAYLSPPDPGILAGNLVADWIKGRARLTLPEPLRRGMLLHRRIDTFTDTHPLVDHCSSLLAPNWNRYAPVLVDIFFDHLLAASWSRYHTLPLKSFAAQTYATLALYRPLFPDRCNHALSALTADDWFSCYATLDGIRLTLTRLSFRLQGRGHNIELAPAVDDLFRHLPAFQNSFNQFFPELQNHLTKPTPSAGWVQCAPADMEATA